MLKPGVRLFHVRHGETDWNREGRLQGRSDTAINATGRAQAARNGDALGGHLAAAGIDRASLSFVSSPLARSRRTMEILRGRIGLPPDGYAIDDRLLEIDFGDWSGFTVPELVARGEGERVAERRRDKWGFVPPGGESYRDMARRIAPLVAALDRDTVCVSHGGVYRAIHALVLATPEHEAPVLDARQDRVALFLDGRHAWL